MSAELETLDQLDGGDLPLKVVRTFFKDEASFQKGVLGLLRAGDIRLSLDGTEVPKWRWQQALSEQNVKASLTDQGAKRIA
jgi:hypothetical protein